MIRTKRIKELEAEVETLRAELEKMTTAAHDAATGSRIRRLMQENKLLRRQVEILGTTVEG